MKNKILSRIISVCLLMSLPINVLAFPKDVDDIPMKKMMTDENVVGEFSSGNVKSAFRLLKYIGATDEEESTFEENAVVTKGYAASVFAAIASGERAKSGKSSFTDVSENHEFSAGISSAESFGIVDVSKERFYPNKNITVEEIADMAVKTLKYNYISLDNSLSVADELKLFKGVDLEQDKITKGQFVLILENVLKADYIEITGVDGEGNATFKINDGKSYLNEKFDISFQEGILTGYNYSSIYGEDELGEGKIQINRANLNIDADVPVEYVGSYIGAYVDEEKEDFVIDVWIDEKKTETFKIEKEGFNQFEKKLITYYEGNKNCKVKISEKVPFIYNDVYFGEYTDDLASKTLPECDRVMVIDNDNDGFGDIVKGYKYTYYIVKNVSVSGEALAFKDYGETLQLTEENVYEFTYDGEIVDVYTTIKAGDILTVLEAKRKNNSKIFIADISRSVEEGKISVNSTDDLGEFYVVENNKYYLSDEFIKYSKTKPGIGAYIQFYLSSDGKIVCVKTEDDFSYGYIMSGNYDDSEELVFIKLYTLEGDVQKYNFAEKVKFYDKDNLTGKKMEAKEAYAKLTGSGATDGKIINDVLAYTLNADGMISSVAVAVDRIGKEHGSLDYPLTLDFKITKAEADYVRNRPYYGVLGTKYQFDKNNPLLVRPEKDEDLTNEKTYQMKTAQTYWSQTDKYFAEKEDLRAYNVDKFYRPGFYTIKGVVSTTIDQDDGKRQMVLVESVTTELNEDDLPVKKINYYQGTKLVSKIISDEVQVIDSGIYSNLKTVDELKSGVVIQFTTDSVGEVSLIRFMFDMNNKHESFGMYSGKTTYNSPVADLSNEMASLAMIYAKVEDIEGSIVLLRTTTSAIQPVYIGGVSSYGSVYYQIYDSKSKKITPATLTDIQPGDTVLMRRYYNSVQDIIIIK